MDARIAAAGSASATLPGRLIGGLAPIVRDTAEDAPAVASRDRPTGTRGLMPPGLTESAMYAAVGLGVALQLVQYVADRSLWNDEALLALNIIHRHLTSLWRPLYFDQAAPIGFLIAQRLVTDILGFSEYAFRLFPLLCGLASVPVFAWLSSRVLTSGSALFATLLFAIADQIVYYASDAKPYEGDVAATVVILAVGVTITRRRVTRRSGAVLAGVAVGAVVFSFAAVFAVAATTVALVSRWVSARERPSRADLVALAPMIVVSVGVVVFGVVNAAAIRHGFGGSSTSFLGASTNATPLHAANLIGTSVARSIGMPQSRPFNHVEKLALLIALIGALSLLRRNLAYFLMIVLPPILVFFAAAVHQYPLLQRAELFLVPGVILLIGEGISWLVEHVRGRVGVITALVLGVAVAAGPVWAAGRHVASPRQDEELRPVLVYVRDHWQRGDLLYVHGAAQYSLLYYEECGCLRLASPVTGASLWPLRVVLSPPQYGRAAIPLSRNVLVGSYSPDRSAAAYVRDVERAGKSHRRVWLLYSHLNSTRDQIVIDEVLARLGQLGSRIARVDRPGAHAYLYVFGRRR